MKKLLLKALVIIFYLGISYIIIQAAIEMTIQSYEPEAIINNIFFGLLFLLAVVFLGIKAINIFHEIDDEIEE